MIARRLVALLALGLIGASGTAGAAPLPQATPPPGIGEPSATGSSPSEDDAASGVVEDVREGAEDVVSGALELGGSAHVRS